MVGSSRLLTPPMPSPPPSAVVEEEHKSVSREGSIVTSISGSVRRKKKKAREAVIMDQPILDSEEHTRKVEAAMRYKRIPFTKHKLTMISDWDTPGFGHIKPKVISHPY